MEGTRDWGRNAGGGADASEEEEGRTEAGGKSREGRAGRRPDNQKQPQVTAQGKPQPEDRNWNVSTVDGPKTSVEPKGCKGEK